MASSCFASSLQMYSMKLFTVFKICWLNILFDFWEHMSKCVLATICCSASMGHIEITYENQIIEAWRRCLPGIRSFSTVSNVDFRAYDTVFHELCINTTQRVIDIHLVTVNHFLCQTVKWITQQLKCSSRPNLSPKSFQPKLWGTLVSMCYSKWLSKIRWKFNTKQLQSRTQQMANWWSWTLNYFPFETDNFIPAVCVLMYMFVFQCVHAVWFCALVCFFVETGSIQTQFPHTAGRTFQ